MGQRKNPIGEDSATEPCASKILAKTEDLKDAIFRAYLLTF